jgi:hypothetical protein
MYRPVWAADAPSVVAAPAEVANRSEAPIDAASSVEASAARDSDRDRPDRVGADIFRACSGSMGGLHLVVGRTLLGALSDRARFDETTKGTGEQRPRP